VAAPDDVLRDWHGELGQETCVFAGDGAVRYRSTIAARASSILESPLLAPWVARLGAIGAARGLAGPPHALQPLYVRRPDPELARERRDRP
jgi:hypothetical protein